MVKEKKKPNLKVVVFCGGVGTRLWPLSREKNPKQFINVVGEQTLLQNTIYNRLRPDITWGDIFISTGREYVQDVRRQVPEVTEGNIIAEPEMRDTAPAVAYAMAVIGKKYPKNPVLVLWQDHLVKRVSLFKQALFRAVKLVQEKGGLVYLGVPPRFASINLGYLRVGKELAADGETKVYKFKGFIEKPDEEQAAHFFESGRYLWNPGYFVTTPEFLLGVYKDQRENYDIYDKIRTIQRSLGTAEEKEVAARVFPTIEKIAIDYVVHENLPQESALVVAADFDWSDVGEWNSLKEALEQNPLDNVIKGEHIGFESRGCLVYSYSKRLVATVDLKDMIIVDTDDVLLVCPAEKAQNVKKLVTRLKRTKENNKYL